MFGEKPFKGSFSPRKVVILSSLFVFFAISVFSITNAQPSSNNFKWNSLFPISSASSSRPRSPDAAACPQCMNGADCDSGTGTCDCLEGWEGPGCYDLDCVNGVSNPVNNTCSCSQGWGGVQCGRE